MRHAGRLLLLAIGLTGLAGCSQTPPAEPRIRVTEALGKASADGFARALAPRPFVFPADHGPHPAYRNEWWYLTGNLADDQGRRYGYQFTLFRIGLVPDPPPRPSRWAASQVWMAHAAVSDFEAARHFTAERFARDALGLAGAWAQPFRLWLEDWAITGSGTDFPWTLRVHTGEFALDFDLSALRSPVLQGDQGLSQKSAEPGNASYYYSITRLRTKGTLHIDSEDRPVSGLSWLDREWSTRPLGPDQAGWDWLSLQLHDGTDFMFYRLRNRDGTTAPESAGMLLSPDGTLKALTADDVILRPLRHWKAPDGVPYPVAWSVLIGPLGQPWRVEAALDDQLMDVRVPYWEGAVQLFDSRTGDLLGRGYLEMTGYETSDNSEHLASASRIRMARQ
jgi:predicted secreted hydrolase